MPDKHTFEFAVIRVVPKVEREEFMNVGVLVFCKRKKYLGIKFLVNEKKLTAFSEDLDLETVNQYLKAWELICKGGATGGPIGELEVSDRFRWLSASKSTIIQCSKTHPGMSAHPENVLKDAFERFVL
jgi:hypothetical protein